MIYCKARSKYHGDSFSVMGEREGERSKYHGDSFSEMGERERISWCQFQCNGREGVREDIMVTVSV